MSDIVERLRNPIGQGVMHQEAADEIERLRDLVIVAQPEIERIEFCEASAEDGMTSRLTTLRQWLVNARRALEGK